MDLGTEFESNDCRLLRIIPYDYLLNQLLASFVEGVVNRSLTDLVLWEFWLFSSAH